MATYIIAGEQPKTLNPENGTTFTLEELQKAVGGYIEVIHLADGRVMVLNEEGRLHGLPFNANATRVLSDVGSYVFGRHLKYGDVIHAFGGGLVGNVLVCADSEID
jgi:hypothetical protein